jgi:hypothetical protein
MSNQNIVRVQALSLGYLRLWWFEKSWAIESSQAEEETSRLRGFAAILSPHGSDLG